MKKRVPEKTASTEVLITMLTARYLKTKTSGVLFILFVWVVRPLQQFFSQAYCAKGAPNLNSLSPDRIFNPHRSILGLGNYDVNVLMAALHTRDLSVVWFDKRKEVKHINFEKIVGFILNVPSNTGIGFIKLPFKFKHWLVIRKIKDTYYNLDSKLSSPEAIGDTNESLTEYLTGLLKMEDREMLLVVKPDDAESWNIGANDTICQQQEMDKTNSKS